MKKFIISAAIIFVSGNAFAAPMCSVTICNKLERFTLSPWSMFKDHLGKTCWDTYMPKEEAIEGKELSSESRWYQGSFNPTKKSVTRIETVRSCK